MGAFGREWFLSEGNRQLVEGGARALGRHHDLELRRIGWDDKQPVFELIEGETILAYTTGWLGGWRFQRALYGELEASHTRLPWTRRRVWSLLTGAASLILWLVVLDRS